MSSPLQESFAFMQAPPDRSRVRPPFDAREVSRLAAQGVFLGTCSWKYRGWEGLIYSGGYGSEAQFQRSSLREYTALLPCVGVDFTYFAWPTAEMMSYLLESTPENFRLCPKVTKRLTMARFPKLASYGRWAGEKNPEYLDAGLFREKFHPALERIRDRLGIVQFELTGPEEADLPLLERFFEQIPRDLPCAVELRSPGLVRPELYARLRSLGLSPCFSSWTRMPPIAEQFHAYLEGGGDEDRSPILGLGLLKAGRVYEEAVQLFQPYRELRDPDPVSCQALAALGAYAMKNGRKAYILVSNRLEGSAPHTLGRVLEAGRVLNPRS